ncbi:MAG: hypothetical protein NVS9B10_28370 [Nevskia sp.]
MSPVFPTLARRIAALAVFAALAACSGSDPAPATTGATATTATKIGHVFLVVLENENAATTFGANSAAPYLSQTLVAQGAYLQNYYGIGHNSNPNYLAMISGQGVNVQTQADCQIFSEFVALGGSQPALGNQIVGQGCVYPTTVKTLADQLEARGLTWRGYFEDMGNTPSREAATCGHPPVNAQDPTQTATAADAYAARHNPFVYFHTVIDDPARCNAHVVSTAPLAADLQSLAATPNFTMIVPNLCHDGHDATCVSGEKPGGLGSADNYLRTLVPMITNSAAFRQDGLLIILFDESGSPQSDASACCGEGPGPNSPLPGILGLGGGKTGAVVLSPFVRPGTVSTVDYNHYGLLRTVEDIFGLDYLGYAGATGLAPFGADVCSRMTLSCSGK